MSFTDEQIRTIIRDTVSKLMAQENGAASAGCLFDDVNDAIAAAKAAKLCALLRLKMQSIWRN